MDVEGKLSGTFGSLLVSERRVFRLRLGQTPGCYTHYLTIGLSQPSAAGYEKSRSLNNISGMTGAPLRLTPITPINNSPYEPYESPGPLRRCRSPIPSIL
ncbi:unnamed protein product [Leuciscus chuanchicus]